MCVTQPQIVDGCERMRRPETWLSVLQYVRLIKTQINIDSDKSTKYKRIKIKHH